MSCKYCNIRHPDYMCEVEDMLPPFDITNFRVSVRTITGVVRITGIDDK